MSTPDARGSLARGGMFVLGLVGRTGSGKSTVARALRAEGAELIEADRIGHDVTDRDPEVRAALVGEYGPSVYLANGALDRTRVADRVFRDARALARLNALVHPRIVQRIRARLETIAASGFCGVVVVDAALMLDWELDRECDAVMAVVADEAEQVKRLKTSRGWSDEEARRRLASQRSNQSFAAAADATLRNDGTEEELARAAIDAVSRLRGAHDARGVR
jgi:dephospho-CoA kinase